MLLRSLLHYAFTNLKRGGKTQLNPAAPWIFLPLPDVVAFLCLERFSEFLAVCMRRVGFVSTWLGSKQHALSLFLRRFPGRAGLGWGRWDRTLCCPPVGLDPQHAWLPPIRLWVCSASLQRFSLGAFCNHFEVSLTGPISVLCVLHVGLRAIAPTSVLSSPGGEDAAWDEERTKEELCATKSLQLLENKKVVLVQQC